MKQINPTHVLSFKGTTHNIYHANNGEGLPAHEHDYGHLTICHSGSCAVRKENKEFVITKADKPVFLIANQWHEIEALEDGTVFENVF